MVLEQGHDIERDCAGSMLSTPIWFSNIGARKESMCETSTRYRRVEVSTECNAIDGKCLCFVLCLCMETNEWCALSSVRIYISCNIGSYSAKVVLFKMSNCAY